MAQNPGIRLTWITTSCLITSKINNLAQHQSWHPKLEQNLPWMPKKQNPKTHQVTLHSLLTPERGFQHIHLDIMGLLLIDGSYFFLLSLTDLPRFPIKNIITVTFTSWVARFRTPTTIITDHGHQFESALCMGLMMVLGTNQIWTMVYYPVSNSIGQTFWPILNLVWKREHWCMLT